MLNFHHCYNSYQIDTEILFLPPDADLWEAGVVTSIKRSDKLELLGVEVLSQNGKNIEIVDMNRVGRESDISVASIQYYSIFIHILLSLLLYYWSTNWACHFI